MAIKKIEEIKEEKRNESWIKKDTSEEKKEIIKRIPVKIDEKSIIKKKDTFTYDKKDKPILVILIDDVSSTYFRIEKLIIVFIDQCRIVFKSINIMWSWNN